MALVNTITEKDFEANTVENEKVAIVDFWAGWCAPCRMMAPVLESIASDMDDRVDVVKVDIEASAENQKLSNQYEVQSIPNLKIFKGGKMVKELIGYRTKDMLLAELNGVLA